MTPERIKELKMNSARPKISRMRHQEMLDFRKQYPFADRWPGVHPEGTEQERKLAIAFFQSIGSPVVTSGNRIYLTTESDLTMFRLGMFL